MTLYAKCLGGGPVAELGGGTDRWQTGGSQWVKRIVSCERDDVLLKDICC